MKLLFATEDLVREGRSFEGFPLLLQDDCTPAEPAQTFLWHTLVEEGGVASRLTWEHYGRWLYDYFQFLQENELKWDQANGPQAASPLSRYRQWALDEVGSSRRTINLHTSLARRFYEWAHKNGYIEHLPVSYRPRRVPPDRGLLAHVSPGTRQTSSIALREHGEVIEILTMDQVRFCREHLRNESHRLLFELMIQTGLRSCEARTFPLLYVYNPRLREDLLQKPRSMLTAHLNPAEMSIKFAKPRTIHIPLTLMERLNAYRVQLRGGIAQRWGGNVEHSKLLLNANGVPFTKDGVIDVFERLEKRVGFRVRAHMLRHTYATHVLRALRKSKDFAGEPLLYVRDRLGHSSAETTAVYLHLINQLEAEMVFAHEGYIDELFARAEA